MHVCFFAAAVGIAAALVVGAWGGVVTGFLVAGAGYAARQVTRED